METTNTFSGTTAKWVFVKAPRRDGAYYYFRSARAHKVTGLSVKTETPFTATWHETDPFTTTEHKPEYFFKVNAEDNNEISLTSQKYSTQKMCLTGSLNNKDHQNFTSGTGTPYKFIVTPQNTGRVALMRPDGTDWVQIDFGFVSGIGNTAALYKYDALATKLNPWFSFMTGIESVLKSAFDELDKLVPGKYILDAAATTTIDSFKITVNTALNNIGTEHDTRANQDIFKQDIANFKAFIATLPINNTSKSLRLNGSNQYMRIPDAAVFNFSETQEFSVTMLVNVASLPQSNPRFLAKRGSRVASGENRTGYDMFCNGETSRFYGLNCPEPDGVGNYFTQWGPGTGKYGQWIHLAFTVSGTGANRIVRMYHNGLMKEGSAYKSGRTTDKTYYTNNARDVYVGYIPAEIEKNVGFLNGRVDNIRFWNKALTAEEIQNDSHLNVTASTPNLLAAYDFENVDYATGTVPDIKGANPGTLENYSSNFRTKANGNWEDATTWEYSPGNSAWQAATTAPTANASSISVGHAVQVNNNVTVNVLTIETSGALTIAADKQLTITNTATNKGIINIKSGATLVGDIAGTATVEQAAEGHRTYYIGSPVSGTNVGSANIGKAITFTENTGIEGTWSDLNVDFSTMSPDFGKGYGIQVNKGTAGATTISFTGTLNNSPTNRTVAMTASKNKFNFLGNPYPSYLKAADVVAGGNGNIEASIYFYTRLSAPGVTPVDYKFVTYNHGSGLTNMTVEGIDGNVAPMQGFWVKANTASNFTFNNTMRSHKVGSAAFRAPQASEKQLMRLQVTNGTEKDETVILFSEAATSDWNSSKPMNPGLNIYTVKDGENLALNSRTAIEYDVETPVGVKAASGEYTFSAIKYENFGTDKAFLLDKVTNVNVNLTSESYTVNFAEAYEGTDRFAVVFPRSGVITGLEGAETTGFFAFTNNNRITVSSDAQTGMIYVFNAVGQQVAAEAISGKLTTVNTALPAGVYVVKLNNLTTKVVVK